MATENDLQRAQSWVYPAEHIGHIGEERIKALEKFKQLCADKKYYTPAQGSTPASHDDETLLRYLRARRWSVPDAWKQFKDTEDWRRENQIDELYKRIDIHEYDEGRKLYPQWTGRRDKRGIPLYVFEVSHLTSKAVSAFNNSSHKPGEVKSDLPPKMLRLFALYEALCNFVLPLCSFIPDRPYPETPVSQSSNIVDISNVSLKQFWNLKSHMQDASQLATAYYPETLDRIFILGAPAFFPTVWSWIKRWFDPITVSKIFILSKETTLSTLQEFIDMENIPKKYGGKLDYTFGDPPTIEPQMQENIKWIKPSEANDKTSTFPIGPIYWKPSHGTMVATAVGSENGKQRDAEVASIIKLPPEYSHLDDGKSRAEVPAELARLPSGVDTHPPTPPPGEHDLSTPPSGATTPASSVRGGTPAPNPSNDPQRLAATSIPFRDSHSHGSNNVGAAPTSHPIEKTTSPEGTTTTVREGTTPTRFEQQSATHGTGQLAHATPDVREGPAGDKHGVMEPNTISQAPKEHPIPETEEEPAPAPTMIEQVKGTASAVLEKVVGVVGLAETGKDEDDVFVDAQEGAAQEGLVGKEGEKKVEEAPGEKVEEFLREKNRSLTADDKA